jgi:hypothetical protein
MLMPAKGIAGLVFMLMFVGVILIYIPVTRWFLLFSVPLGIIIALIISYWHKRKPVELDRPETKKPLGLE